MTVGLIDVDGHNFPNLPLMKLAAYHRRNGDDVEMVFPLKRYDRVYASKVFTFSPDIQYCPMTDDFRRGGTGYGLESLLPDEVEHIMPDYSLYGITNTAYGFLSRGCPRRCPFCIVSAKEGHASKKVCDLREWWDGQRNIVLLDPNILACPDALDLLGQLAESKSEIDITQGLDIRLMADKVDAINKLRMKMIHFAWDGTEDLAPLFSRYGKELHVQRRKRRVYVLTNFNTTREWDLHRIYVLRDLDYDPFVMVYDRTHAPKDLLRMQRWVNNKFIFNKCKRFEEYI